MYARSRGLSGLVDPLCEEDERAQESCRRGYEGESAKSKRASTSWTVANTGYFVYIIVVGISDPYILNVRYNHKDLSDNIGETAKGLLSVITAAD